MMPVLVPFDLDRAMQVVTYLQYADGTLCRFTMRIFVPSQDDYVLCELYSTN